MPVPVKEGSEQVANVKNPESDKYEKLCTKKETTPNVPPYRSTGEGYQFLTLVEIIYITKYMACTYTNSGCEKYCRICLQKMHGNGDITIAPGNAHRG